MFVVIEQYCFYIVLLYFYNVGARFINIAYVQYYRN